MIHSEPQRSLQQAHTMALPALAHRWFELTDTTQLPQLQAQPGFLWSDVHILAGGSNCIFLADVQMVLHVNLRGREVVEGTESYKLVIAAAGENWDEFVSWTIKQGCFGLENLSLIPGSVGAAPIQNIGAYGVEVSDIIDAVQVYDYHQPDKCIFWVEAVECQFAYRNSKFKQEWAHLLIVAVRFKLATVLVPKLEYAGLSEVISTESSERNSGTGSSDTDRATALHIRQQVIRLRQSKLPDPTVIPNAGSFFKNPLISIDHLAKLRLEYPQMPAYLIERPDGTSEFAKVPAAWLLDSLGFKGRWHGAFGCYQKQPLVLVHDPDKPGSLAEKADQFISFVALMCEQVQQTYQICLEPEPIIISD